MPSTSSNRDHVAMAQNERLVDPPRMLSAGANADKASEKKRVPTRADIIALQEKLAARYRTLSANSG
jgi:hypothetical protein